MLQVFWKIMKNNTNFFKYSIFLILLLLLGNIFLYNFGNKNIISEKITVPNLASSWAKLFYNSAVKQIGIVNAYDFSNWYYKNWWYPPGNLWVCSDVIRRSFKEINIDFKNLIDADIKQNNDLYNTKFDSNINFRRVKNINTFLGRKSKKLTNTLIPGDIKNLTEWQTWDIVIFDKMLTSSLWHIGIISEKRRSDWVPYMIDNHGYWVDIRITPLDWSTKIVGHYRYF